MAKDCVMSPKSVKPDAWEAFRRDIARELRPHLVAAFEGLDEFYPDELRLRGVGLCVEISHTYKWDQGYKYFPYVTVRYDTAPFEWKYRHFRPRQDGTLNLEGIVKAAKEMYLLAKEARSTHMLKRLSHEINHRHQQADLEAIPVPQGMRVVRNPQTGLYALEIYGPTGEMTPQDLALVIQIISPSR